MTSRNASASQPLRKRDARVEAAPTRSGSTARFEIERWSATHAAEGVVDWLAVEEPLEIRVRHPGEPGATVALTMRTPGRDADLAIGFLHGEGLLVSRAEAVGAEECANTKNVVNVTLAPDVQLERFLGTRQFYTTSSCGLCGKKSLEALLGSLRGRRVRGTSVVSAAVLRELPARVRAAQDAFDATGGLHGAAFFTPEGAMLDIAEDVGRHNAVDKIVGRAWLQETLATPDRILFLSGRAGFELVQKAVFAGCPIVAAVGAPSSLAVDLAREAGLTLVGFLNAGRFNVYSGPEHIHG
jgi:FdhD protein